MVVSTSYNVLEPGVLLRRAGVQSKQLGAQTRPYNTREGTDSWKQKTYHLLFMLHVVF